METLEILLPDEAATAAWAARLAAALSLQPLAEQAFVVHLSGELGAGKTALARALLRSLGFTGAVKSPTFALVEPYNLPSFPIYHFDLYRFSSSDQWFDAGFDDILAGPGLMLLEWPEQAAEALAPPDLLLRLSSTDVDDQRELQARAYSREGQQCLISLSSPDNPGNPGADPTEPA